MTPDTCDFCGNEISTFVNIRFIAPMFCGTITAFTCESCADKLKDKRNCFDMLLSKKLITTKIKTQNILSNNIICLCDDEYEEHINKSVKDEYFEVPSEEELSLLGEAAIENHKEKVRRIFEAEGKMIEERRNDSKGYDRFLVVKKKK